MSKINTKKSKRYKIIEATGDYKDMYRIFCQKVYEEVYPRPEFDITKDLFSKEVFDSAYVRNYFDGIFDINAENKGWLAINDNGEVLGGVGAKKYDDYVDMKAFYVNPSLRGKGIGSGLFGEVIKFSEDLPVRAWVYEYLDETISMYEHWGFKIDKSKGKLAFDWEPWPRGIEMYAICMVKPAGNQVDK